MVRKIFFLFIPFLLLANNSMYKLKKQKEKEYQFIDKSGIKEIVFEKKFIKILFNDNKLFCENKNIITDNCSIILNKKDVINNVNSTEFLKELQKDFELS